jgi:hypothetical protein
MIPSKRIPTSVYKKRVLDAVESFEFPVDVNNVRASAGLHNWESTKALLLELTVEGKLHAFRTSRGWVFSTTETLQVQQLQR